YDGSRLGPADAKATVVIRSPDALRRIVTAPDELGFGRAFVAGDADVEGDIFEVLSLRYHLQDLRLRPRHLVDGLRLLGVQALRPLPPPAQEGRLLGGRHSIARDAAAVAHHYDVSIAFYGTQLGVWLTYSCTAWCDATH